MNPDELIKGLRGLKDPVEIPEEPPPFAWQPWVFGILGLILLTWLAWKLYQHLQKRAALAPATEALTALTKLSREGSKADSETFVMKVSTILRGYVESSLGMQALRLSTEEFLEQATESDNSIKPEHRSALKKFLQQCDLVKFARGALDEDLRDDLIENARGFIRESSTPPDEPKPSAS